MSFLRLNVRGIYIILHPISPNVSQVAWGDSAQCICHGCESTFDLDSLLHYCPLYWKSTRGSRLKWCAWLCGDYSMARRVFCVACDKIVIIGSESGSMHMWCSEAIVFFQFGNIHTPVIAQHVPRACHFSIFVTEMLRHSLSLRQAVCMTMFDTKGLSGWDRTIMTCLSYEHMWPLLGRFTLTQPLMCSKPICYGTRQTLCRRISIRSMCNPDKMEMCCLRATNVGLATHGCVLCEYARK